MNQLINYNKIDLKQFVNKIEIAITYRKKII